MSSFTENTNIAPLPKENKWVTTKELPYCVGYEGSSDRVVVPEGFKFDGASVPSILCWFGQKVEPKTISPACVHDRLYVTKPRTRREADRIFWESLLVMDVNRWKAAAYFVAVSLFGWIVWRRRGID